MRLAVVVARRHGIDDPVRPLRSGANHVFRAGDVLIRGSTSTPMSGGPLPFCSDPAWLAVEQNLAEIEAHRLLDADGLAALRDACVALRGWQALARREATVVCHGDV